MQTHLIPPSIVTFQVIAVQNLAGRKHDYVRVFGFDVNDTEKRIREVALSPADAVEIIKEMDRNKQRPEIEILSSAIVYVLSTGDMQMIHLGENDMPGGGTA